MKDRPSNRALEFIGLMTVLGAILLGGLYVVRTFQRAAPRSDLPTPASEARIIAEGWDAGVATFLLDVPESCPVQSLEYRGWQKAADSSAALRFVVSKMNEKVTTVDAGDFAEFTEGTADLALKDDAVYALTVQGINARWRFAVTCR